ncbi:P-loop containing nucleoside triphosphate hydrolase protein [Gigaspora rosea]|uniref:RNA helicase n=1 Tax=Gigaspora rosea TaxID=44941 RepID=A0A397W776_9GLOM|nr:P-loop containing nucleoside triphosphate hydrolase protein [Gigaspora rosea]
MFQTMFVPRSAIKRPSSTPVKTSKKVKTTAQVVTSIERTEEPSTLNSVKVSNQVNSNVEEVEDPIKEYSYRQREASTGEPVCVVCGKYGEYICDETDHDVCSIECKKIDIERTTKITNNIPDNLPKVTQPVPKYSHNIADTTFVSGDTAQMLLQVTSDIFHAQLTAYLPHQEIKVLSSFQVQSILSKNRIIVHGKNIPRPITKFEHCKLPPKMIDNLQQVGYMQPTEIQMQVIPTVLVGRDILASAQTGSGKTAAFLIPIIIHTWTISQFREGKGGPYAIIMAPTRELCSQIEELAKKMITGLQNMKTALIVGGIPISNQIHRLKKGVQIVIATPGRLLDIMNQYEELIMTNNHMFVIDEVDMMFKMGFEKQVNEIIEKMTSSSKGRLQILMFSATIPDNIEKQANLLLHDHIKITVGERVNKINNISNGNNIMPPVSIIPVKQTILWVENKSKKKQLFSILNDPKYYRPPIIVFVESKMGADLLSQAIEKKCGARTVSIHGDKSQKERTQILQSFLNGEYEIIVSTGVLSRGLDLSLVNMVVNFDMAVSIDEYVHQCGRVSGSIHGWAVTFINEDHKHLFKEFVSTLKMQPSGRVTPLPSKLLNHGYTLYGK